MALPLSPAMRRALVAVVTSFVGVMAFAFVFMGHHGESKPKAIECGEVAMDADGTAVLSCMKDEACLSLAATDECQDALEMISLKCEPIMQASQPPMGFNEQLVMHGAELALAMREGGYATGQEFGRCLREQAAPIIAAGSRRPRTLAAVLAAMLIFNRGDESKGLPVPDCEALLADKDAGEAIGCYMASCSANREQDDCASELKHAMIQCKMMEGGDEDELDEWIHTLTQERLDKSAQDKRDKSLVPVGTRKALQPLAPPGKKNTKKDAKGKKDDDDTSARATTKQKRRFAFIRGGDGRILIRPRRNRRQGNEPHPVPTIITTAPSGHSSGFIVNGTDVAARVAIMMDVALKAMNWDYAPSESVAAPPLPAPTANDDSLDIWSSSLQKFASCLEDASPLVLATRRTWADGGHDAAYGAAALPAFSDRAGLAGLAVASVAAVALSLAAALRAGGARRSARAIGGGMELSLGVVHV